jgi:hypothetical protein
MRYVLEAFVYKYQHPLFLTTAVDSKITQAWKNKQILLEQS